MYPYVCRETKGEAQGRVRREVNIASNVKLVVAGSNRCAVDFDRKARAGVEHRVAAPQDGGARASRADRSARREGAQCTQTTHGGAAIYGHVTARLQAVDEQGSRHDGGSARV